MRMKTIEELKRNRIILRTLVSVYCKEAGIHCSITEVSENSWIDRYLFEHNYKSDTILVKYVEIDDPVETWDNICRYIPGIFISARGFNHMKLMHENPVTNRLMRTACPNEICRVIFNDPATIVFWADGSKTVVKADGEKFDPEKGLAMAISKKFLGNSGDYYEVFKNFCPEEKI